MPERFLKKHTRSNYVPNTEENSRLLKLLSMLDVADGIDNRDLAMAALYLAILMQISSTPGVVAGFGTYALFKKLNLSNAAAISASTFASVEATPLVNNLFQDTLFSNLDDLLGQVSVAELAELCWEEIYYLVTNTSTVDALNFVSEQLQQLIQAFSIQDTVKATVAAATAYASNKLAGALGYFSASQVSKNVAPYIEPKSLNPENSGPVLPTYNANDNVDEGEGRVQGFSNSLR